MTEKVCKLYEEEQIGKMREQRKAVPTSKMPDLGWDIAETQLIQENQKENNRNLTSLLGSTNTNHDNHLDNSHLEAADNTN